MEKQARYVYRYTYCGEVIYIGKADSTLSSRINAHRREEKFQPYIHKAKIEYILLPNPAYTHIYETYYINKLKPILNTQMKYDEEITFDLPELEWFSYEDGVIEKIDFGNELKSTNKANEKQNSDYYRQLYLQEFERHRETVDRYIEITNKFVQSIKEGQEIQRLLQEENKALESKYKEEKNKSTMKKVFNRLFSRKATKHKYLCLNTAVCE